MNTATSWKIEYDNDTGINDESYRQWWTVTNGKRNFKCDSEEDAKWLMERMQEHEPAQR